jgi:hypothetical protein
MDVQLIKNDLYILDYESGVYQFTFEKKQLFIVNTYQFSRYLKMAVNVDSLVISKKGSVTEFGGRNTFKYEAVGS